jgi:NAD(P)-dependent dehydrogenase (short-subunit alcohol dehydrogenase family)
MAHKTWFITGTSRGFGRIWTEAALARGDRVAATARDASSLAPLADRYDDDVLLALELDVTDRQRVFNAVRYAAEHFGGLDVIVNNAGTRQYGSVEELTEPEVRAQMETNFFGALWVTQAALPILREQRRGHLLQISSIGGIAAFATNGAYHASKWALEGLSESLAQEVAGHGIAVTLIEPGAYATDRTSGAAAYADELPAYADLHQQRRLLFASQSTAPAREQTVNALFAVVDAAQPPLRILLSARAYDTATTTYQERLSTWATWQHVSRSAG